MVRHFQGCGPWHWAAKMADCTKQCIRLAGTSFINEGDLTGQQQQFFALLTQFAVLTTNLLSLCVMHMDAIV